MTEVTRVLRELEAVLTQGASLCSQQDGEDCGPSAATDARFVLEALKRVSDGGDLAESAAKLERRAEERDPVSGNPKYGEGYRNKVKQVRDRLNEADSLMRKLAPRFQGVEERIAAHDNARLLAQQLAELERMNVQKAEQQQEEQKKAKELQEKLLQDQLQHEENLKAAAREIVSANISAEDRVYTTDRRCVESFLKGARGGNSQVLSQAMALVDQHAAVGTAERSAVFRALKHFSKLWERIVAHPESEACRTINAMNDEFRTIIASVSGGRELVSASGFVLRMVIETSDQGVETKHVSYFLEEPNLETDMDRWESWFAFIKIVDKTLQEKVLSLQ